MINHDRETRQLIVDTAMATPGVAGVLARRGQLLISRDVDPVDAVRVKSDQQVHVDFRIAIVEGEPAIRVLQRLEANLIEAVPTIEDKPVKWSITAASARADQVISKKPALDSAKQTKKLDAPATTPQLKASEAKS